MSPERSLRGDATPANLNRGVMYRTFPPYFVADETRREAQDPPVFRSPALLAEAGAAVATSAQRLSARD